jgi:sarcosine reductase
MRLEMADFPVNQIRFGNYFTYRSGALEINRDELVRLVLGDDRIERADLEIVAPGERVRITGIRDVVEPRIKVQGEGQVFPGALGPVRRVGEGKTHRLSGMAVVTAASYDGTIRAGTGVERSSILDMWGPAAEISRFSARLNLVLILKLKPGLAELDAHSAIQRAELEIARRVAEVTVGLDSDRVAAYALDSVEENAPKVVLIQGCITQSGQPHSGVSYYGLPIRDSLATFVHPNELFDGAVTVNTIRGVGYYPTSWDWQNHPLALGLYREHFAGRLKFKGIVLERISFETHHAKEVAAHAAAQLADAVGADAALITWLGSGNAFVDVMLTIQACENRGIKTVLVTYEYGGKDGTDSPLLFYAAEADAVVSTGSRDRWIELPIPEKVIGPYDQLRLLSYPGAPSSPARGQLSLDARDMVIGGVDIWGRGSWTCREF